MKIKLGDEKRYNVIGIGIVTIQRESGSPLTLKDFMFFLGLKKNLIFVTVLEDHGCEVTFIKGKVFLRQIAMGEVKKIRVCVKNLHKLDVNDYAALSTKGEKV